MTTPLMWLMSWLAALAALPTWAYMAWQGDIAGGFYAACGLICVSAFMRPYSTIR